MSIPIRKTMLLTTAVAAVACALLWNARADVAHGVVSVSEARIGRPLTPMSYAGVARRTTRRAVYGTAAAAAAAGAYVATRPGCVQVTNAYGEVVTKC
jgi:predicted carbohydrate-binding protein with CBM5 and CBM33 domain